VVSRSETKMTERGHHQQNTSFAQITRQEFAAHNIVVWLAQGFVSFFPEVCENVRTPSSSCITGGHMDTVHLFIYVREVGTIE
jgi:hypothetical protein